MGSVGKEEGCIGKEEGSEEQMTLVKSKKIKHKREVTTKKGVIWNCRRQ